MADFTNRTEMLAMVQRLAKAAYNADMAEMHLDLSVGTDAASTTHYRPFWVAAKLIQTNPSQVTDTSKASFVDPLGVADNLLEQQQNYDDNFALTVPDAYQAYRRGIINFYTPPAEVTPDA